MRANRVKEILRQGGVALGVSQAQLPVPEVARLMAAAGFDWLFIDSEHGPFTSETLHEIVRACLQTPMSPVVRVPDFQYDLVARVLDSGAEGVMFPRTEAPDALAKAIGWAKFPPQGVRGFGLGPPQVGYINLPFEEIIETTNRETLVIAQIESVRGLQALPELTAVEGLDALLVGPADMSVSLGVGGQWDSPRLLDAIDQVVAACNAAGKWPAIHVRDANFAKVAMEHGMKLVSCGNDLAILWGAVSGLHQKLRDAAGTLG